MHIYRIVGWTPPKYKWQTGYKRIATHRYCTKYTHRAYNHRSVSACANWVRRVDKEAKFFFFRMQSNWHCSPCKYPYNGHPTTGTTEDRNTRIFIFRIINWKAPTYVW